MKQNTINIIIILLLVIIGGILIYGLFNKKSDSNSLELIKAKDETIKAVVSERDAERNLKDYAILQLHVKDSLLQTRYKTNTIIYEKIPVTVANYSDDELKRAVEEYR